MKDRSEFDRSMGVQVTYVRSAPYLRAYSVGKSPSGSDSDEGIDANRHEKSSNFVCSTLLMVTDRQQSESARVRR